VWSRILVENADWISHNDIDVIAVEHAIFVTNSSIGLLKLGNSVSSCPQW